MKCNVENMEIEKLNSENYVRYLEFVRQTRWGNVMMPDVYTSSLWGGVVCDGLEIIGGWVGTLRGNRAVVRLLAKSVYFDSYPMFVSENVEKAYQKELIDTMREWAKKEGIVMFNMTHWVRGYNLPYLRIEKKATFILPLQATSDEQWKLIESKQRNIVRKGEKNGVEVRALTGEEAIAELPTLQLLREQTQQHAIRRHANATMLLKSDNFFANLLRHTDATLFIGSVEGKPATVAVMIMSGETAYYYSGGSDYELNRQTGSSAYVIWKAIEYYREREDVKYMDMGGVPLQADKNDPAYGVYTFKRSFGGEYVEYQAGTIVINRSKYALLSFLLKQRKLLRMFSKSF